MNDKEDNIDVDAVLSKVTEAFTEKPMLISISLSTPRKIDNVIVNTLKYQLKPIKVGNMYRIAGVIRQIPDAILDNTSIADLNEGIYDHMDKLIYIVAVGLQNNADEPAEDLIKLIRDEFTIRDIVAVYDAVMVQMNLKDFIKSIILIKGADILKRRKASKSEMSPVEQAE